MSLRSTGDNETLTWAKEELDKAVREITDQGAIESLLVEARPAWAKPFDIVIGQLRDQGAETEFLWIIGGTMPIDYIHSAVAATPRDAARHFSMKWQLEAARYGNPADRLRLGLNPTVDWEARGKALVTKAEYLHTIVVDDQLWS
jgi:hypothetical protein